MKNIDSLRASALAACLALGACGGIGDGVAPSSIEIQIGGVTEDGEVFACVPTAPQLIVRFDNNTSGLFASRAEWSSSDDSIVEVRKASLDRPGTDLKAVMLLPKRTGTATLRAEYIGFSDEIDVTVSPTSLQVAQADVQLIAGARRTLNAVAVAEGRELLEAIDLVDRDNQLLSGFTFFDRTLGVIVSEQLKLEFDLGRWTTRSANDVATVTIIENDGDDPEIDDADEDRFAPGTVLARSDVAGTDIATYNIGFCGQQVSTTVTVHDVPLERLEVTRAGSPDSVVDSLDLAPNSSIGLSVTGHYEGGLTQDLTGAVSYTVENSDMAAVGVRGTGVISSLDQSVLPASNVGQTTTLTVAFDPDGDVVGDEITAPPIAVTLLDVALDIDSLSITPQTPLLLRGGQLQFRASGDFSGASGDFPGIDITRDVTWLSSSGTALALSNRNGFRGNGVASETVAGEVTVSFQRVFDAPEALPSVTAVVSGVIGDDNTLVDRVQLDALRIEPESPSLVSGGHVQLRAIGSLRSGERMAELDVTDLVVFSSSDPAIVAVSNGGGLKGRAQALGTEPDQSVQIEARFRDHLVQELTVSASVELTLNPSAR